MWYLCSQRDTLKKKMIVLIYRLQKMKTVFSIYAASWKWDASLRVIPSNKRGGLMEKTLLLGVRRSGVWIPGWGKCSLRTITVDTRVKYSRHLFPPSKSAETRCHVNFTLVPVVFNGFSVISYMTSWPRVLFSVWVYPCSNVLLNYSQINQY